MIIEASVIFQITINYIFWNKPDDYIYILETPNFNLVSSFMRNN